MRFARYAVNLHSPAGSMRVEVEASDCHTACLQAYPAAFAALSDDLKNNKITLSQYEDRTNAIKNNIVTVTFREMRD